jgi:SAM-dependent methyltransferase
MHRRPNAGPIYEMSSKVLAKWRDIWARLSGPGAYPHELSGLLLLPLRRVILSPEQLVEQLRLSTRSRVLEIGPGPGFFSPAVARAVRDGRLELVDIQREMLLKARRRLRARELSRVGLTQAGADALPFIAESFDVAFLVAVLGEVPDPAACVRSVARVLQRGGRLVCAELPGDPDAFSVDDLCALAAGTGLSLTGSARVGRATVTTFQKT